MDIRKGERTPERYEGGIVTFNEYLESFGIITKSTSAEEDFIIDAQGDKDLPTNLNCVEDLVAYMEDEGASDGAILCARSVWAEYEMVG